ncbi:MAG TPA: tetratricopeptide repeat protein [Burkholderiales bacterium]|nr:tetratricopeptide repeat protein [Burkholderiales bacterium]
MSDSAAQGAAPGTSPSSASHGSSLPRSDRGRWNRLLAWLPAWLVFMVYLPALGNGFVWDDTYFLTDMPFLRSPELWPRHIFAPLFVSENYFRPLPLLQYVIEGRLSNLNPFLFHLTNLLLHAANTFMVGVLARRLVQPSLGGGAEAVSGPSRQAGFRAAWISAGAALLFGLHPALIESVCWVSDRFDLMMTAMLLLALCCDTGARNDRLAAVMTGALFLLGLLSKESTVLFMAVLPVWHLAVQARARPVAAEWLTARRMMMYAALFVALALYLLIRRASLGGLYHTDTQIIPGTLLQHGLLVGKTLGWYLLVALWPFGLVGPVHPGRTPLAADDALAWAGVLAVVLALAGAVWLIRRVPRAGWLLLCAACALGPVSNLLPLTIADNVIQDRYLIFPVAMLALAAAVGLAAWLARPRPAAAAVRVIAPLALLAAAWCAAALVSIFLIVPRWASDLSLWSWGYGQAPTSKIATGNYMTALANAGRNAEVIEIGKTMLDRYPDTGSVLHNIGLALMRQGRDAEAIDYVKRALRYLDDHGDKRGLDRAEALNLLGLLYMRGGDLDSADKALREAVKTAPFLTRPHFNLAMLAYQRRDIAGARREMDMAIQYDAPQMAVFHRRSAAEKEKELGLADSPYRADAQAAP